MKITIIKENQQNIPPIEDHEFPEINRKFQKYVVTGGGLTTRSIEDIGAGLMKDHLDGGFNDIGRVNDFVRQIFKWGEGRAWTVHDNLYDRQSETVVASVIGDAAKHLKEGDLKKAIEQITVLGGLGLTFGSAILRMLSPKQAAMGAYIPKRNGDQIQMWSWSETTIGHYPKFCEFCETDIIAELQGKGISNLCRKNGEWFVADIEAVMTYREKGYP